MEHHQIMIIRQSISAKISSFWPVILPSNIKVLWTTDLKPPRIKLEANKFSIPNFCILQQPKLQKRDPGLIDQCLEWHQNQAVYPVIKFKLMCHRLHKMQWKINTALHFGRIIANQRKNRLSIHKKDQVKDRKMMILKKRNRIGATKQKWLKSTKKKFTLEMMREINFIKE